MRSLATFLTLCCLFTNTARATCEKNDEQLRNVKLIEWPSYYRNGDIEGLKNFLLDGFRVIANDGSVSTKNEEISYLAKNRWSPEDFSYTIFSITCFDATTALIIGEGKYKQLRDGSMHQHRYVSSNVLKLVRGRWRPASSHISGHQAAKIN